jgi:hypothetical protein
MFAKDAESADSELMEALKYIDNDDTPENLARYHNKKGNEYFKKGEF